MALLDRLAQAQQIVSGYENREINKQRYETDLGFRQSAEERAMAAENRAAQLFPTEKAMADFRLAGAGLGISSVMDQLSSAEKAKNAEMEFSKFQGDIYRAMQGAKGLKAETIADFRNRAVNILGKYPSFAPQVTAAMGQISSVEAAAIKQQKTPFSESIGIPFGPSLRDISNLRYVLFPASQRDRLISGQETTSNLLNLLSMGDPAISAFFQQQPE